MEGIRTNDFLYSILCCSQSGDGPQEGLAKFDYKLNIEVKLVKHSSIIFGCPA